MKQKPPLPGPSPLLRNMLSRAMPDIREPSEERAEGHLIELSHSLVGSDGLEIAFDIAKAPVPPRRYVAEVCSVGIKDCHLRLVFGQRALGDDDQLDSALVIRLSPHAAHNFVNMVDGMNRPGLEGIAAVVGVKAEPLLVKVTRPTQMAHLEANIAALGVSGFESCLDFYHASPFAMKNIEKKKHVGIEPVVRVTLSTGMLLSLISRARELVVELPAPPASGEQR